MDSSSVKKKLFILTTIPITLSFFKGQIQVLKKIFDVELVSSPDEFLVTMGTTEQVDVHGVKMERDISIFRDLKSLFNLYFLFKEEKPYIVHGNTPKGGLLSMISSFFARVPKRIYCIHGLRYQGMYGIKRELLKTMEKLTCFLATDILTVSVGIVDILKEDGITSKKGDVIGNGSINGIDLEYFSSISYDSKKLRSEYNISDKDFVYGFMGRLVGDKGINELIEAFINLSKKDDNLKLLLVGGYEEELDPLKEETLNNINNHPKIISAGYQKDIRSFLMMMDVFVFPTYREGLPVSIMEAGAMNIPVISSNISGCNEIVEDQINGLLIEPKSVDALTSAMHLIRKDTVLHEKLVVQSRLQIEKKFEQKHHWKAIESYYKDYMNL